MKTGIAVLRVCRDCAWVVYGALFLYVILGSAVAATDVSGTVSADTAWTLANSPYHITGDVTVEAGVTLAIEAGVTVQAERYKGIYVDGTLDAVGSEAQPITFTGTTNTPGWWGSVYIRNSGTGTFEWCDMAYGGNNYWNNWGGSQILYKKGSGSLFLRNSTLHDASNDGLRLMSNAASFVSESNTFYGNGRYGVVLGINASYEDLTSVFVSNGTAQVCLDAGTISDTVALHLSPDYSFYLRDNITIAGNGVMSIGEGTIMKFGERIGIFVNGILIASGTSSEPVYFTDYRDDTVGGDTNNDGTNSVPAPGWWGSIRVQNAGSATLDWCTLTYGGNNYWNNWGGSQNLCKNGTGSLTLRNSTVCNSSYDGMRVTADYSSLVTESNMFCNNGRYGVVLGVNASYVDMTSAYTNNGEAQVRLDAGTISESVSFRIPSVYAFYAGGDITIASNGTMNIGSGTIMKFGERIGIFVNGILNAPGTRFEPVYFTDYRDDTVGGDTNNDGTNSVPAPGWWGSIRVQNAGSATLDWCTLTYGGNNYWSNWGGSQNLCKNGTGSLTLRNSTICNSSYDGMRVTEDTESVVTLSNRFQNNGRYGVAVGLNASFADTTSEFVNNGAGQVNLDDGTISQPVTLTLSSNYAFGVNGYITIASTGAVSISAGSVVKLGQRCGIYVNGTLSAAGTSNEPVYFTDYRDDTVGGDTNNDGTNTVPSSGWWGAVRVQNQGSADLQWTCLRYGGDDYWSRWGGHHGLVKFGAGDLSLTHCILSHCQGRGMSVINSSGTVALVHSTFTSNTSAGVYLNNGPATATGCIFSANTEYGLLQEVNDGVVYADNVFQQDGTSAGVGINSGTRTSNWTWSKAGNPYRIAGRFTIASNVALSVLPGTVVQGGRYQGIYVDGTLNAVGTASERIYFTGATESKGWWGGLRIQNAGSARLEWCDVGYGGDNYWSYWGGRHNIYKTGTGALELRHSTVHDSYETGLRINEGSSSFVTETNVFRDNGLYGVYVGLNASFSDGASDFVSNTSYDVYVQYGTINKPVVLGLKPDYSLYVPNNLTIDAAGSLTLGAGSVIKFPHYYGLLVDGELTAQGTKDLPVCFTDIRDDSVGGDANKDGGGSVPSPGYWGAIHLRNQGSADLEWVHVLYPGYNSSTWDGSNGLIKSGDGDLVMNRCRIARSYGNGLNLAASSGNHEITRSVFESNNVGVSVREMPTSLSIVGNQFVSNTTYGVYCAADSAYVDARRCWWGDATGPYHPTLNTNGLANEVSDRVYFDPWRLSAALSEIVAPPGNAEIVEGDALRFVGAPGDDASAAYAWDFGDGRTSTNRDAGVVAFSEVGTNQVTMALVLDGVPDPLPDTRTITVFSDPGTLPDLEVSTFDVPSGLRLTKSSSIAYTVSNNGDGPLPESVRRDAMYITTNDYLDTLATPIGSMIVTGALNVGSSWTGAVSVTLPQLVAGNYQLFVSVDDGWQLLDKCRLNNECAATGERPCFFWSKASQRLFHGQVDMEWSTIGLQNTSGMVRITSTYDETVQLLATTMLTSNCFTWDTTALPNGQYLLKAVPSDGGADYPGEPFIDCLINNAVHWRGGTLYSNETWTSGTVYVVEQTLEIQSNTTVTIEAGAIIKFADGTGINILNGGALFATNGPVVFTALADDSVGGDTNLDGDNSQPYPGSWLGISPQTGSTCDIDGDSVMNYICTTHAGTASASQVWLGTYLHIVEGEYTIPSGMSLTIEPGAVVKMQTNAAIVISSGASLSALGEVAKPIVFTTVNDDSIAGDTQSNGEETTPAAGDWKWIYFNGSDGVFDHCEFRYGGGPAEGGWGPSGGPGKATIKTYGSSTLVISNSMMMRSCFDGVLDWGGPVRLVNSVFIGCDRAVCAHPGGTVSLLNSTLDDNKTALLVHGGRLTATNCIVANNFGVGLQYDFGTSVIPLAYNCFWNPTNFSGTADVIGTNGNFSADPSFKDRSRGVYQLQFGSSCIDAGQTPAAPPTDLMNAPRYTDPRTSPKKGIPDAEGVYADVGAYEFVENAESDLDLVVSWVEGPDTILAGEEATVRYQVVNRGTAPVSGNWHDKLFLLPSLAEAGSSTLDLGDALVSGTIAPEHSLTFERTVTVPYATEGEWRWQAQVNDRGEIFEGRNWLNNYSPLSAPVQLSVQSLAVGQTVSNVFGGVSSEAAVIIQQAVGEDVLLRWRAAGTGTMRLYAAYERMPTESDYDVRSPLGDAGHVRLGLTAPPVSRRVYVMAQPFSLTGSLQYTVSAEMAVLELDGVTPNTMGNAGDATLCVEGNGLSTNMTLTLQSVGGTTNVTATRMYLPDASRAYATFPLEGVVTGRYHLVAADGGSVILTNTVTVSKGSGGRFVVNLLLPEAARIGRSFEAMAEFANAGDADVIVPLLSIYASDGTTPVWAGERNYDTEAVLLQLLAMPSDGAPFGVLRPGQKGTLAFFSKQLSTRTYYRVEWDDETATGSVDWDMLRTAIRPPDASTDWSNAFNEVLMEIGYDWSNMVVALSRASADVLLPYGYIENRPYKILDALVTDRLLADMTAPFRGVLYLGTNTVPLPNTRIDLTDENGDQYSTYSWIDGRFVLAELPQADYRLDVAGYIPRPIVAQVQPYQGDLAVTAQAGATLVGRVLEADQGVPVSNVTVTVCHTVEDLQFEVKADDSGLYRVGGLVNGDYTVSAEAENWVITTGWVGHVAAPTSVVKNVTMSRGGSASGNVLAPAGGSVSGALIQVSGTGLNPVSAVSESDGTFCIPGLADGTYTLYAAATGGLVSVSNAFTISQSSAVTGLTVQLGAYASLLVTVTNADTGLPATNVNIAVAGVTDQEAPWITDATGQCRIDTLQPGAAVIWAYAPEYQVVSSNVTITAGTQTLHLLTHSAHSASVTLKLADDTPLANTAVLIVSTNGVMIEANTGSSGQVNFSELADGHYLILLANGTQSAGRPLAKVELSAGTPSISTNQLLSGTVLSGSVLDMDDTPVTNANVALVRGDQVIAETIVNTSGAYAFLVEGTAFVSVVAFSPTQGVMMQNGVSLSGGSSITNIDLTATSGQLHLTARSNVDNALITNLWFQCQPDQIMPKDYRWLGMTDASGVELLTNVPTSGTLRITAYGQGYGLTTQVLTLTGTVTSTTLLMDPEARVQGTIKTTGGDTAGQVMVILSATNQPSVLYGMTDTSGVFSIESVAAGTWNLDVVPAFGCPVQQTGLVVTGGIVQLPLITLSDVSRTLEGTVQTADGIPVFGTPVDLVNEAGEILLTAMSDNAGTWRMHFIPTNGFALRVNSPAGSYWADLSAQTQPANTHPITLVAAQAIGLNPDALSPARGIGQSLRNFRFFSPVAVPQRIGDNVWDWAQGNFADTVKWRYSYNDYEPVNSFCEAYDRAWEQAIRSRKNIDFQFNNWMSRYQVLNDSLLANAAVLTAQSVKLSAAVALFALALEPVGAYAVGAGVVTASEAGMVSLASTLLAFSQNTIMAIHDSLTDKNFNRTQTGIENTVDVLAAGLDTAQGTTLFGPLKFLYDRAKDMLSIWSDMKNAYYDTEGRMNEFNAARAGYYAAVEQHKSNIAAVEAAAKQDCSDDNPCCSIKPDGTIISCLDCCPTPPQGCSCVGSGCGGNSGGGGGVDGRGSFDPNDKQTTGYGAAHHVLPGASILYTIRFENQTNRPPEEGGSETLPAQHVYISDQLEAGLDWSTFELVAAGFNDVEFSIPAGLTSYSLTTNVVTDTYPVDFAAVFNEQTGLATWSIDSRDPQTGTWPDDMDAGFLPPNTNPPAGEGWVSYRVEVRSDLTNTVAVTNMAEIYFDENPVILTPGVTNTIDVLAPTSAVAMLPTNSLPSFTVNWSGSDATGVGISGYDIYRAINQSGYQLWITNTTDLSATCTGGANDVLSFYAIATDHLGQRESDKTVADAITTISANPVSFVTALPPESEKEFTLSWSGSAPSGSPILTYDIYSRADTNAYTLWLHNATNTSAIFTGQVESTYYFYSIVTDGYGYVEDPKTNYDTYTTIKQNQTLGWLFLLLGQ